MRIDAEGNRRERSTFHTQLSSPAAAAARQVRAHVRTSRGERYFATDAVACRDMYWNVPKLAAAEDDPAPHPNAQSRDCETVGGLGGAVVVVAMAAAGGMEEVGAIVTTLLADDAIELTSSSGSSV